MSQTEKRVSQWKLMLVGTSSVVGRRLLVVALSAVSLAVWTVTVIGTGVMHGGGMPMEAAASLGLGVPGAASDKGGDAAASGGGAQEALGLPAVELPLRDPFTASAEYFPRPKSDLTSAGGLKSAATQPGDGEPGGPEGTALTPDKLVPLQVEGTLLGGKEKVAIVRGNSVRLGDQLKVLVVGRADGQGGQKRAVPLAGSASNHLRIGDEVEVRAATAAQNRYWLSEEREVLKVKEITHRGFSLTFAGKDYVLEMEK